MQGQTSGTQIEFGGRLLPLHGRVRWTTSNGRLTREGILRERISDNYVRVETAFKTNPMRRVHVGCDVRVAS